VNVETEKVRPGVELFIGNKIAVGVELSSARNCHPEHSENLGFPLQY